jgi:hypothetical protein
MAQNRVSDPPSSRSAQGPLSRGAAAKAKKGIDPAKRKPPTREEWADELCAARNNARSEFFFRVWQERTRKATGITKDLSLNHPVAPLVRETPAFALRFRLEAPASRLVWLSPAFALLGPNQGISPKGGRKSEWTALALPHPLAALSGSHPKPPALSGLLLLRPPATLLRQLS